MKGEKIESFEDLEVYQRLCQLHLEINDITLKFPQFELRELGSHVNQTVLLVLYQQVSSVRP